MSATGATLAGRRAAEGLMTDTCTITRGGGDRVFDPPTGEYVTTAGAQLYSGRCRVRPRDNADQVVEAGGQTVSLFPYVVSLPVSAVPFAVDDLVTVTDSRLDPALVGVLLRVRQVNVGSQVTARRLGCELDAG